MSTPKDIRIQAQTLSGTPVDSATSLVWLQEQIKSIAYNHFRSCPLVTESVYISGDDKTYTPEKGVVVVDRVFYTDGGVKTRDWTLEGNTFTFFQNGAYLIKYYAMPNIPATENDEIELPSPYVVALKFFIASRIRARYMGQSDTNAVSFYEEYVNALKDADVAMKRRTTRHRVMPPGRRAF